MKIITSKYWNDNNGKLVYVFQNYSCLLAYFKDNKNMKTSDPIHLIVNSLNYAP